MKTTITLSTLAVLATLLVAGCNKDGSSNYSATDTNSPATNAITGGTGGMMNNNTVPTNLPDMTTNTPATTNNP